MISVIVPSYNSENTISKCLDALQNQSYTGSYEIILIDSSFDNTPEIVSNRYPGVRYTHLKRKTDPGTARNMGIEISNGDLIAFIDSDCVAAHDWLEQIVRAHDSPYKAVGGVVYNGNDENDLIALAGYISEFREFLPARPRQEVSHIPTCNISYKRGVFDEYGLFQGNYYPQEDLVYNIMLSEHGERILLDPSIRICHHHRSELQNFLHHQKRIGRISSVVLKSVKLEGAFIARNKFLGIIFSPLLPVVKFTRTVLILLKYHPRLIVKRPMVLLIFCLGLIPWAIGFAEGIFESTE